MLFELKVESSNNDDVIIDEKMDYKIISDYLKTKYYYKHDKYN